MTDWPRPTPPLRLQHIPGLEINQEKKNITLFSICVLLRLQGRSVSEVRGRFVDELCREGSQMCCFRWVISVGGLNQHILDAMFPYDIITVHMHENQEAFPVMAR